MYVVHDKNLAGIGIFAWWVLLRQVFRYLAYPDTPRRYAELALGAYSDTPSRKLYPLYALFKNHRPCLTHTAKYRTFLRWMFQRTTVTSEHRQASTEPILAVLTYADSVRFDVKLQLQLQIYRQS